MQTKLDKFLKYIWLAIGLIILTGCLVTGIFLLISLFENHHREDDGVITGKTLEEAKKEGLALQGIAYTAPASIYNSTNQYILISAKTYEEAKAYDKNKMGFGSHSYSASEEIAGINFLFVDSNYKVIRRLLNKKASISSFLIPGKEDYDAGQPDKTDTTVQNIAYLISFEDTNKDGLLNAADADDLYISDLSGGNLTKVTENIDVINYYFQNHHTQLFITFTDRSDEREEYKKVRYAVYTIASRKLRTLEEIDKALVDMEKTLTN